MTEKTQIKSRPATAEDIRQFFGQTVPQTVRARVLEIDGKKVGIAGYYLIPGGAFVFSDQKDGIPKIRIWREAKALMASLTIPAFCTAEDGSGPFLERLGWVREGEVYKWQHS